MFTVSVVRMDFCDGRVGGEVSCGEDVSSNVSSHWEDK